MAQWANALAETQCSEPVWLLRWCGFDSHCYRMSSQVSACYEIKILGQVQRVRLCPLSNVKGHHSRDKLPVFDHFRFLHAPFSAAILSKEYITRTTISK